MSEFNFERNRLAIIIPAYKLRFLKQTLDSIANQTNKNFTVYIGNDNSPEDLEIVISEFDNLLKIVYHKFENNIGSKHLVKQWARCIELAKTEEWLWLFSDDDLADFNCVETFFKTIESDGARFDVYRFNTRIVNDKNELIFEAKESPFIESSIDMTCEILRFNRGNSMPDHIFSRHIYNKCGGFVHTDYAQAADWGTSILFSAEKGICSMKDAKISWRLGEYNISGHSKKKALMLSGHLQFLLWLRSRFSNLEMENNPKYKEIENLCDYNLQNVILVHYKHLYIYQFEEVYKYYVEISDSKISAYRRSLKLYASVYFKKLENLVTKIKHKLFNA